MNRLSCCLFFLFALRRFETAVVPELVVHPSSSLAGSLSDMSSQVGACATQPRLLVRLRMRMPPVYLDET